MSWHPASDRVDRIILANGHKLLESGWVFVPSCEQFYRYDAAVAAEERSPANLLAGTGWLFGDDIDWRTEEPGGWHGRLSK